MSVDFGPMQAALFDQFAVACTVARGVAVPAPARCIVNDGVARIGQFCIDLKLAQAVRGDVARGLFFRGRDPLPFGERIRPVAELMRYLLTGERPDGPNDIAPAASR